MTIQSLIGKSVKVELHAPIKTHIGQKKVIYGHLKGVTKQLIQVEIGWIDTPKEARSQVHIISKDLIKSISKEWLEPVVKGNKEWYRRASCWIPARDE